MAAESEPRAASGVHAETKEPWVVAASYAQERVWLASQVARDVPVYHVVDRMPLHTRLTEQEIHACFGRIVARHETLRTAFRVVDGALMQVVHPVVKQEIRPLDLRGEDDDKQLERVRRATDEMVFEPFDLGHAPLWRALLARYDEDEWLMVFVAHHTVFDATSVFNIYAEMTEIVAAAEQNRPPSLPELTIQYADYAAWQRERLSGPELDDLSAFWGSQLADLPAVHGLPTDRPRPPERTFAGSEVRAVLPPEALVTLPEVARRHQATSFMVLLAAYVALLHRRSERHDIVVGVPVGGRDRPELLPLIGMFVNMVVLRVDASGDPTFAELIDQVRNVSLAAWDYQEMPYQKLVETLAGPREPGVPPLYQLGFNLLTTPDFSSTSATSEDDLLLEVTQNMVRIEYDTALFDAETAGGLLYDYVRVLTAGLADTATVLSRLPVSGGASRPVTQETRAAAAHVAEHIAPRTAAEELVAEVWSEVLGIERVGALDDFFDLGGHSLLALRVIARLSASCGVELSIQAFFTDTTVAGVASELERLLTAELDQMSEDEALRLVEGNEA